MAYDNFSDIHEIKNGQNNVQIFIVKQENLKFQSRVNVSSSVFK